LLPNGKNELERFVDKFGNEIIREAIMERLLNGSGSFIDESCTDFSIEDMCLRYTRNLAVEG